MSKEDNKNIYKDWLKADSDKTMESGRRGPIKVEIKKEPIIVKKKAVKGENL